MPYNNRENSRWSLLRDKTGEQFQQNQPDQMQTSSRSLPVPRRQSGQQGQFNQMDQIDLMELFHVLLANIIPLLVALIIGVIAAGSYTYFRITPTYKADSYLYMVSSSSGSVIDLSDLNLGSSVSNDYEQLLVRRSVLENVVTKLSDEIFMASDVGEDQVLTDNQMVVSDVKELANYISIGTVSDSRLLQISVITTSPKLSKDIANAIAEQAVEFIPKIMNVTAPTIAEYAVIPTSKYAPNLTKNALMGGMVCFAFVAGIIVLLYLLDDTIKTEDDFEKTFGIVPLAVIPEGEGISDKAEESRRKSSRKNRKKKKAGRRDR